MKTLSYKETVPLVRALMQGAVTTGIMEALKAFEKADSKPPNLCAGSILLNLNEGCDYQTSFREASPALPPAICEIIVSGFINSVLDHALDDIALALGDGKYSEEKADKLASLASKYGEVSTKYICKGCLEREFKNILSRAVALNAKTVELEQLGDSFLEMSFKAEEPLLVRYPTHSLIYTTLLNELERSSSADGMLRLGESEYGVERTDINSYAIFRDSYRILVVFKGAAGA
jgi:hypothetical protein